MSQENLEIVTRLSEHLRASYAGGAATDGGALVLAIREGRVQSVEIFSEQRDAVEALGLPDDVAAGLSAEQP
jgi:hypothetical protein